MSSGAEDIEQFNESSVRRELVRLVALRTATQGHQLDGSDVDRFIATLRTLLPAPRTLVDAGCGTGVLTDLARHLGYESTGVDLDAIVMERMASPSIVGSIGALPFPDRSFEISVANEVLEHLPVDVFAAARAELGRVTSHQVVITVPNRESLESASTRCPACLATYSIHGHVRRFGPREMVDLIPGFSLNTLTEVGPYKIRHRSVEWILRRRLLGQWPAQPGAICFQCGWRQAGARSPSESGSRLSRAFRLVAGIPWERWWLVASSFDLVTASLVLSSVLDPAGRAGMAAEMRRIARPDGLIAIYDFRIRKPWNHHVRSVADGELKRVLGRPWRRLAVSPFLPFLDVALRLPDRVARAVISGLPRTHRLWLWRA